MSSFSRANATATMGASSSLSPDGYHTPQEGHPHWGRDMGAAPSGQWIGNPPQPAPYGDQDDRFYSRGNQMGNAAMGHPSLHHIPPPIDDLVSSREWRSHVRNQHSAGPHGCNSSRGWNEYGHYPTQKHFMPAPLNHNVPHPFAGTCTHTFSLVPASELMGLHFA
jgi:hypothetical protein